MPSAHLLIDLAALGTVLHFAEHDIRIVDAVMAENGVLKLFLEGVDGDEQFVAVYRRLEDGQTILQSLEEV